MQKINVEGFYHMKDKTKGIRENSRELKERINLKIDEDINEIDHVYDAIDEQEKRDNYLKYKVVKLHIDDDQINIVKKRI